MNENESGKTLTKIVATERLNAYYELTRPKRRPSENSVALYVNNFYKLHYEVFGGSKTEMDSFEWISEMDAIKKWFADTGKSVPTIRNYITALLIVSLGLNEISQKSYSEWEVIRDNIVEGERKKSDEALKSEKQADNFVDAKIINDKIEEMGKDVKMISKKGIITNEDKANIQIWMILRILQVYHMRNEVASFVMMSYREFKKLTDDQKVGNYIVWDSGKKKWFISANEYKTKKTYGEKITIVDDKKLSKDLGLFHKINGFGIMFKNSFKTNGGQGTPLNANDLSKLLAKWSKNSLPKRKVGETEDGDPIYKDRSISTTMLAKIFYSDEGGQVKQEIIKSAKARGHDVKTALNVYTATPEEIALKTSS